MIWIVFASVIALLLLMAAPSFFRWRNRQLTMAHSAQEAFYRAAAVLVEDEDTPLEVMELIKRISDDLPSRTTTPRFLLWMLSGKGRRPESRRKMHELLETLRPELRQHLMLAIAAGVLRITYNNAFFGTLVRRLSLASVEISRARQQREDGSAETAAAFIAGRNNHGGPCATAA